MPLGQKLFHPHRPRPRHRRLGLHSTHCPVSREESSFLVLHLHSHWRLFLPLPWHSSQAVSSWIMTAPRLAMVLSPLPLPFLHTVDLVAEPSFEAPRPRRESKGSLSADHYSFGPSTVTDVCVSLSVEQYLNSMLVTGSESPASHRHHHGRGPKLTWTWTLYDDHPHLGLSSTLMLALMLALL
jgi:hypothetical protein